MSTKDQAWAERVGREAVALGVAPEPGLLAGGTGEPLRIGRHFGPWYKCWPDFRDRLTELACIAWVEDVAREVYGVTDTSFYRSAHSGKWDITVGDGPHGKMRCHVDTDEQPTLAEACIAAVRDMKGGEFKQAKKEATNGD